MNDDVKEVRALLAEADPGPPGTFAGAARDGRGQAALVRIIADRGRDRAPSWARRNGLRVAVAGGLGVALAAGVTVVQVTGGVDGNGKPRPVVPGLPAGPVANAQELLNRAATAAQARPFTPPRPDQWGFTETRYERIGALGKGKVATPSTPRRTSVDRVWIRADGTRLATYEGGKLQESATGGGVPPTDYASLAKLPRDPDALLAHIRKEWTVPARTPAQRDEALFGLLGSTLNNSVLPPAQEAAIYRTMARFPGVALTRGGTDIAGRPVVAVSLVQEGWIRQDVLLDPKTYAYRGHRSVAVADHRDRNPEGGWAMKKGTIESQSARLAAVYVDKAGQRP